MDLFFFFSLSPRRLPPFPNRYLGHIPYPASHWQELSFLLILGLLDHFPYSLIKYLGSFLFSSHLDPKYVSHIQSLNMWVYGTTNLWNKKCWFLLKCLKSVVGKIRHISQIQPPTCFSKLRFIYLFIFGQSTTQSGLWWHWWLNLWPLVPWAWKLLCSLPNPQIEFYLTTS